MLGSMHEAVMAVAATPLSIYIATDPLTKATYSHRYDFPGSGRKPSGVLEAKKTTRRQR